MLGVSSTPVAATHVWSPPVLLLGLSGVVMAVAGGLRWAFDAGAATGQVLIAAGVVVVVAAVLLRRVGGRTATWAVLALAAVLLVVGAVEIASAIATIADNGSAHLV